VERLDDHIYFVICRVDGNVSLRGRLAVFAIRENEFCFALILQPPFCVGGEGVVALKEDWLAQRMEM